MADTLERALARLKEAARNVLPWLEDTVADDESVVSALVELEDAIKDADAVPTEALATQESATAVATSTHVDPTDDYPKAGPTKRIVGRVMVDAAPAREVSAPTIPRGVLESAIKSSNEKAYKPSAPVGRPVSRTEALAIARNIGETAERERNEAVDDDTPLAPAPTGHYTVKATLARVDDAREREIRKAAAEWDARYGGEVAVMSYAAFVRDLLSLLDAARAECAEVRAVLRDQTEGAAKVTAEYAAELAAARAERDTARTARKEVQDALEISRIRNGSLDAELSRLRGERGRLLEAGREALEVLTVGLYADAVDHAAESLEKAIAAAETQAPKEAT